LEVLTASSVKMAVFCQGDDGGSKFLWNVGQYLPDYTAEHPRRQPSLVNSYVWEQEMDIPPFRYASVPAIAELF
jgi:hypothetical protein